MKPIILIIVIAALSGCSYGMVRLERADGTALETGPKRVCNVTDYYRTDGSLERTETKCEQVRTELTDILGIGAVLYGL